MAMVKDLGVLTLKLTIVTLNQKTFTEDGDG